MCFRYTSSTIQSANLSYCGFPTENTIMRFVFCTTSFVILLILFFNTPLSFIARPIFVVYALLFFAIAVLDCNAVAVGEEACLVSFQNTEIQTVASANNLKLVCQQGSYVTVCVFDLIISGLFFFIYTAWLFCKDKYVRKPNQHTADQKALMQNPA
jgi:hypothetical protein